MSKQRRGIVSIDMGLLNSWMNLPLGTQVVDVRRRDDAPFGQFEVLIEGDAVPETDASQSTPHMLCSVTISEPKVTFTITEPTRPRKTQWKLSAANSEEHAA